MTADFRDLCIAESHFVPAVTCTDHVLDLMRQSTLFHGLLKCLLGRHGNVSTGLNQNGGY
jgi:hypothetical protein